MGGSRFLDILKDVAVLCSSLVQLLAWMVPAVPMGIPRQDGLNHIHGLNYM